MKRTASILLLAVLLIGLAVGCAGKANVRGQADNDILTYTRIDPKKTLLIVSKTGNIDIDGFSEAFMERNPDVQVVCIDITGGNADVSPVTDWIRNGVLPDLMFMPVNSVPSEISVSYMTDLSGEAFLSNFESQALNAVAIDAHIYWLPGPSQIDCMIYNKTLFDQYGWKTPKSFDEFVSLCLQIREDTNGEIQPWNPNAKYSDEFQKATEGFMYHELFGGLENYTWYKSFCSGEATFAGHMEPYYAMLQTLIDNGILLEEHFSYSATTRGKEFASGKIAMCNIAISKVESEAYEFDYMPFPTTAGEDGYICNALTCELSEPVKEHTEAQRDAIARYLAFFGSAEGQKAFINDMLMVSSVKDVPLSNGGRLASLQPTIEQGHMFSALTFSGENGRANFSLPNDALAMIKGERTAQECIAAVDAQPFLSAGEEAKLQPEIVATAAENFTILETSNYIADMYREQAGTDIGLIANNVAYRGNLMRIFAGGLTASHINTLKPRSLGNDSTLVRAAMTGKQLLDALNHPVGNEKIADCVYAFSGLKCKVAPWNEQGARYVSVALSDGTALDPDETYTVAFWDGTVDPAYITGEQTQITGTFEERMLAKMAAEKSIAPAHDGRITLIWK